MSDTVIRVENLGKKYIIGHQPEGNSRYVALRDVISNGVRSLGQRLRHPGQVAREPNTEEFWALKDVSFEVKQGEVIGIIGRNGAGKSTLLKILSRITEPTTGRVSLKGRVASLLEVGTGFHPELTGRENIFLNGAILGMSRHEINRKFDEIVDFAEVSQFLDTPVKRYSSGMYVRLAFAVAAHLEPEILIIDEVLAVGDTAFQKKCLGKIKEVSTQNGRTILFVSHNMGAVSQLTQRCLLLSHGVKASEGSSEDVIERYFTGLSCQGFGTRKSIFKKEVEALDEKREIEFLEIKADYHQQAQQLKIAIKYIVRLVLVKSVIAIRIDDSKGMAVATVRDTDLNPEAFEKSKGVYYTEFTTSVKMFLPGIYWLTFSMADMMSRRYDYLDKKLLFEIAKNQFDLTPGWSREGVLLMSPIWTKNKLF